jgi:hypothetical protein
VEGWPAVPYHSVDTLQGGRLVAVLLPLSDTPCHTGVATAFFVAATGFFAICCCCLALLRFFPCCGFVFCGVESHFFTGVEARAQADDECLSCAVDISLRPFDSLRRSAHTLGPTTLPRPLRRSQVFGQQNSFVELCTSHPRIDPLQPRGVFYGVSTDSLKYH